MEKILKHGTSQVKYDAERLAGFDRAFTADPFGNRIELLQSIEVERN